MSTRPTVVVSGGFDDLRSRDLRFLQEAAQVGAVTVMLWNDEAVLKATGKPPRFPLPERQYLLQAVRFVERVAPIATTLDAELSSEMQQLQPWTWVEAEQSQAARQSWCERHGIEYRVIPPAQLASFPTPPPTSESGRKKVVVTGCYDWLHSGHVRFFEEVSTYGDLYVVVGHDANLRLLKGPGHPLLPQEERRYQVGSIKYVTQALISSGQGWLDADPEIRRLKPDIYAVNEDGDRGGKREYCEQLGIEYLVLRRKPAPGLPQRTSTELRGF